MNLFLHLLALSSTAVANVRVNIASTTAAPRIAAGDLLDGQPLDSFLSYSIEFSSFPDFAGNETNPNTFSNNLLNNLGYLAGTKPYIRVGGNTQDYAIYNADLSIALNGTVNATRSPDYPTTIEIGPSFFESYQTWPNTKFSHGFNLGGNNDSRVGETLLQTAALACKALGLDKLYMWEYGNEPDLYSTSSQGPVRDKATWTEEVYVGEWLNGTRMIKDVIAETCPDMLSNQTYGYMAPSFAGISNTLKAPKAWAAGLDTDGTVRYASTHNYIDGATSPGVTLQGTLMNHTRTVSSVQGHVAEFANITNKPANLVQILGETNSLYNQGKPGLSNSFGAALWGIDFALYSAAVGIGRIHFHQGTNYRYQSWQPIETSVEPKGTKAPYYGNIAVAAFLGNLNVAPVRVVSYDIPVSTNSSTATAGRDAVYAAYVDNDLSRLMVLNLRAYNYTLNGTGDLSALNPVPRPVQTYTFGVAGAKDGQVVGVSRLYANGSDAVSGISWDGISYNYELANGKPVRLHNVTIGETVTVAGGAVEVKVPDSQAVVLDFDYY